MDCQEADPDSCTDLYVPNDVLEELMTVTVQLQQQHRKSADRLTSVLELDPPE